MTLTKEQISSQLGDLIGLPYSQRRGHAYRAVRAVFTSITNALKRGEVVTIKGFGTFKIKQYASHQKPVHFFYKKGKKYGSFIHTVPAHKRVIFIPHNSLKHYVNQDLTHAD